MGICNVNLLNGEGGGIHFMHAHTHTHTHIHGNGIYRSDVNANIFCNKLCDSILGRAKNKETLTAI